MERILKRLEEMARKYNLPIIGPEKGKVLADTVKRHQPKHVLEIGTNVGYSAVLMSMHFSGKITTIEISPRLAKVAEENFRYVGLSDRITVLVGPALDVLPMLKGPFDMLFLDAVKEEYYDYLRLAEPKMAKNAVVVADNVGLFEAQMKKYLDYVRTGGEYFSATYDFGFDAVEVSER
jgi:predicted O-methyltransferase YrrM